MALGSHIAERNASEHMVAENRCFTMYRPYVVVSMRMRYMCAFLLRVSVTVSSLRIPSSSSSAKGKRERERRARESVHRCRLCDQESARLQRPPRKGRPTRRRVRDRTQGYIDLEASSVIVIEIP